MDLFTTDPDKLQPWLDYFSKPATFYTITGVTRIVVWLLFSASTGFSLNFHHRGFMVQVPCRPTWLPLKIFQILHNKWIYMVLIHISPFLLILTGYNVENNGLRLLSAVWFSIYACAESSLTRSHRDYGIMYVLWALVFLPDDLAQAVALGVGIIFISHSGFCKLIIGGYKWMSPNTMGNILKTFGQQSIMEFGPLWHSFNRFLCSNESLLSMISIKTLIFECIMIPAALFLPQPWCLSLVFCQFLLHVGIALIQSLGIGIVFLPNLGLYCYAFSFSYQIYSKPWLLAQFIFIISTAYIIAQNKPLPEKWPLTTYALFTWNGHMWATLYERFVSGRYRIVLSTNQCKIEKGWEVLNKWEKQHFQNREDRDYTSQKQKYCYNGWEMVIGQTLIYDEVYEALKFDEKWDIDEFLQKVEQNWLRKYLRLIELNSGKPLVRAYYVELEVGSNVIKRILNEV